jgi:hypothetical protein
MKDSAGNLLSTPRGSLDVITITPTVEATALDAGDVAFDATLITGASPTIGGTVSLETITIIDLADQGAEMVLVFMSSAQVLGTLDSAPDIDDTEVLAVVGVYKILTTDYIDLGGSKVATIRNLGMVMKTTTTANLWVGGFIAGTPTYGAGSPLRLLLGFSRQ